MSEVFRGWRWKIGVVTLVMACGFMAEWVRSYSGLDLIAVGPREIKSLDGAVRFSFYDPAQYRMTELLAIPYWSIVIPLTALSAFLLLSMPRQSTTTKTTDPIAPKLD